MKMLPLQQRRIAVTRASEQAGGLTEQLRSLGAEPIVCPVIAFAPPSDVAALDHALHQLATYDWLLVTSANTVRALFERITQLGLDPTPLQQLRVGAIGPATAQALAQHGIAVSFIPSAYVAESILAEIGDVRGQRILLPRADIARATLADGLRVSGAIVDEVTAYRTIPGTGAATLATLLPSGTLDAITFTSSSTVRYLLDGLEAEGMSRDAARALLSGVAVVCIGPITATTARQEGLRVAAEASEYTAAGVVAALVTLFDAP